jgi:hypothetical protein
MSAEVDTQEILKRLKALEEENARLRKETNSNAVKPLVVTEGEYMGHPTLTFEGPCKPFTIGLKKLSIIKQGWPQVEQFLERQAKAPVRKATGNLDDDKI